MMKTLNDYMVMSYRMEIVEDKDEGGFVVSYPDLPGCITCGETLERAVANAVDAKKAWLEAALEYGIEIHEPDSLEDYSGQFKLRILLSHQSTDLSWLFIFGNIFSLKSFDILTIFLVSIPCRH